MAAAPAHVHVESMQTAVPTRVAVAHGRSLPISVPAGRPLTAAELQRRFRSVLYYRGADGAHPEGAASARLEQAMWVKESLSAALSDHPKMAGRLWRHGGDNQPWEVKLSDSGVRLVLASADTTIKAFLEAKKGREGNEAALALWTDVDAQDPEMCAPFIIQKLGIRKPARFTVLAGDGSGRLNVHTCTRGDGAPETTPSLGVYALRAACWNKAGLEDIALDGSKPVHVSCSVVSPCADEGLVVVMPARGADLLIDHCNCSELGTRNRGTNL